MKTFWVGKVKGHTPLFSLLGLQEFCIDVPFPLKFTQPHTVIISEFLFQDGADYVCFHNNVVQTWVRKNLYFQKEVSTQLACMPAWKKSSHSNSRPSAAH